MSKPPGQIIYRDQLITMTDLDNFKNELLAAFRTMLFNSGQETATAAPAKKWLKSYEVKRILKISTGTLQHLRNSKQLPFSKLGGTMYYDAEVIAQLLAAREHNPSVPLAFQKHSIKSKKEKRA
jgi:hypothetical protein